jgi:hypothetical protein
MRSRTDRTIRLVSFFLGVAAGVAVFAFVYSNTGSQNLDWLGVRFNGVPVWSVGVVPLVIGLVLGYLYHFPARWYHYKEHMRYKAMAAELERENEELRQRAQLPPSGAATPPEPGPPEEVHPSAVTTAPA